MTTFHTAEMMMTKEEFQAAGMEFIKEAFAAGKMTGAELKEIRLALGLSCNQMGAALGMEGRWRDRTIRKYEFGTMAIGDKLEAKVRALHENS